VLTTVPPFQPGIGVPVFTVVHPDPPSGLYWTQPSGGKLLSKLSLIEFRSGFFEGSKACENALQVFRIKRAKRIADIFIVYTVFSALQTE
jgi:hypothetical protein